MTVGRFAMRGRAFQGRWAAGRALANSGVEPMQVAPNDGWIAETRFRASMSESRSRISVAESRDRIWIARGKAQ